MLCSSRWLKPPETLIRILRIPFSLYGFQIHIMWIEKAYGFTSLSPSLPKLWSRVL
jgi:hypothetical protein